MKLINTVPVSVFSNERSHITTIQMQHSILPFESHKLLQKELYSLYPFVLKWQDFVQTETRRWRDLHTNPVHWAAVT